MRQQLEPHKAELVELQLRLEVLKTLSSKQRIKQVAQLERIFKQREKDIKAVEDEIDKLERME